MPAHASLTGKCAWLAVSLMTTVGGLAKYFGRSVDVTGAANDNANSLSVGLIGAVWRITSQGSCVDRCFASCWQMPDQQDTPSTRPAEGFGMDLIHVSVANTFTASTRRICHPVDDVANAGSNARESDCSLLRSVRPNSVRAGSSNRRKLRRSQAVSLKLSLGNECKPCPVPDLRRIRPANILVCKNASSPSA